MFKNKARALGLLFMFTYMASYLTRINYGAVILEMVNDTGYSKALLSVALTGSFITYGAGQVISGFFGDRIQPKKLVLAGLLASVGMNLLIPLCARPWQMTAVWCVNGFAQAFMWPPIVKLMTGLLNSEEYKKASMTVSMGSSAGTVLIYLVSPLFIGWLGWRSVFLFSAACGLVMALVWLKLCPKVELAPAGKKADASGSGRWLSPMLLTVMLAIVLQGALRDGVTTWMPSYISETYNLGSSVSILTGVALPLFSVASFKVSQQLYSKKLKNPVVCAGAIFAVGTLAALALVFTTGHSAAASVFCTALLTGCMHGVNLILICMVPAYYHSTGKVGLVSGAVNACTYVGSAASTYGIALLTESAGWHTTLILWCAIAAAGTLLCFACVPAWKKKFG